MQAGGSTAAPAAAPAAASAAAQVTALLAGTPPEAERATGSTAPAADPTTSKPSITTRGGQLRTHHSTHGTLRAWVVHGSSCACSQQLCAFQGPSVDTIAPCYSSNCFTAVLAVLLPACNAPPLQGESAIDRLAAELVDRQSANRARRSWAWAVTLGRRWTSHVRA